MVSGLDALYQDRLLELAGKIARNGHEVDTPTSEGSAYSAACGSKLTVRVRIEEGRITDYGQDVDACALGSAAASVVGANVVGLTIAEVRTGHDQLKAMLKSGGPPPTGAFEEMKLLEGARDFTNRHGSMLLAFTALEKAFKSAGY